MEPRPQPRNNSRSYLLVALLVLAALNVLLLYFYYQERQDNKTKDATIAAKTEEVLIAKTKLDSISAQLDAKIAEIQQLGGNIDSLMKVKAQLEVDKNELKNVGSFDSKKYDQKIRNYQALLAQKDQEIARLKEENGVLTQQNATLAEENTGLKAERQTLSDSVVAVSTKNQELNEKVTIAAALRAENITVDAINKRGKEKDGGTYKAKRIDKIKVSVRLAPNGLAKQEEKVLYMRILDPSGAVLSDLATGSGEFTYGGQGMIYTAMQRFNFDNSRQTVDFIYGRGAQRFNEGKHVIEIYCEGFRIGEGEFTVK
ncbi:cell division protein ZapB [Spirosoma aerolatum]|uniref:cell division protein ZapB n=1 Tax=Spirosoma aerolatum TaxID=1211326 RepID=UPI0009AED534|nr:cell division protein ZapB [Spirosoma aerolatum]